MQVLPKMLTKQLTYTDLYQKIALALKNVHNLFLLAKGVGFFVCEYAAQKFT